MKNLAIARRYAKALLLIGKEDGQADGYRDELSAVAGLIAEDKSLGSSPVQPPLRCRQPAEKS